MQDDEAKIQRGRELMREICGADAEPDDPWLEISYKHVFSGVWDRPGLTRKERRWISLTLAASSGQKTGYMAHLRGALESGDISESELWEWLVHYAHYAGWPASANIWGDLRSLLDERKAEASATTSR